MLTSALRALVKNPVKKSFDITFIGNEKSCQNINYFFYFLIKTFLTEFLTSTLRTLVSISLHLFIVTHMQESQRIFQKFHL